VPADIKFGVGTYAEWLTVEADVVMSKSSDLMLDSPSRRKKKLGLRRALVHDVEDGLTINFNGDYPGGVTLNGARLNLKVVKQGSEPSLPKTATVGDVLFIRHSAEGSEAPDTTLLSTRSCSLWICVAHDAASAGEGAWWQQIPLDDPVQGTA
jgi:hypothetical protein